MKKILCKYVFAQSIKNVCYKTPTIEIGLKFVVAIGVTAATFHTCVYILQTGYHDQTEQRY